MAAIPEVLLYGYPESPFAQKVEVLLTIRKLPYKAVLVSRAPPRPELKDLGIDYRRIPVLSVNETVYCDTFAIAEALEAALPASPEHPSLFPAAGGGSHGGGGGGGGGGRGGGDVGAQKALAHFWTDRPFFSVVTAFLPWKSLPEDFLADRSAFRGDRIDPSKLQAMQPFMTAQLAFHLELVEQQLQDGRRYLFDTPTPGYADASVYTPLRWLAGIGGGKEILTEDRLPKTKALMAAMGAFLKGIKPSARAPTISGDEAAALLAELHSRAPPASSLRFDDGLAAFASLRRGLEVSVVPDDTGKVPTVGRLVGLSARTVIIETKRRKGDGVTRVAFPRLGYVVLPCQNPKL